MEMNETSVNEILEKAYTVDIKCENRLEFLALNVLQLYLGTREEQENAVVRYLEIIAVINSSAEVRERYLSCPSKRKNFLTTIKEPFFQDKVHLGEESRGSWKSFVRVSIPYVKKEESKISYLDELLDTKAFIAYMEGVLNFAQPALVFG